MNVHVKIPRRSTLLLLSNSLLERVDSRLFAEGMDAGSGYVGGMIRVLNCRMVQWVGMANLLYGAGR